MLTSVKWLNALVAGPDLTPQEIDRALTHAGFPVEGEVQLPDGDTQLDVEITSNRGDCMSHLGLAREVAAALHREIEPPQIPFDIMQGPNASSPRADTRTSVDNQTPDACSQFTARILTGVTVRTSPDWLIQRLEAVGQRPINNIVDASNYVLFELGNPTHTFDLNTLTENRLVIRYARDGEPLTMLDGKQAKLRADELVVADAQRAVSLAGVMGGLDSSVTSSTTDILLEAAAWSPPVIRRAARRLNIVTDAGKRFERTVDARTVDRAAARVAQIILETGGGELLAGAIAAGPELRAHKSITLRTRRCHALLGVRIEPVEMTDALTRLGFQIDQSDAGDDTLITAAPPANRAHDIKREIDLIEEVARVVGYDRLPIHERMEMVVAHPQEDERARRAVSDFLVGAGFYETVTFSFTTKDQADLFLPAGLRAVKIDEERRKETPFLRPSVIPSLLECRKVNQDAGARIEGGVRLFEIGAGYAERDSSAHETVEQRALAMILDAPDKQLGLRQMRGVIEALVRQVAGMENAPTIEPVEPSAPAHDKSAGAAVSLDNTLIGRFGLISKKAQSRYDLDTPVVFAEMDLDALLALYPPASRVDQAPAFPAIERDLSVIIAEDVPWRRLEELAASAHMERLEEAEFVGVYRGKQVGPGRKSVTLRLRFRDPARTLTHEEVDPEVEKLTDSLKRDLKAEFRAV